MLKVLYAGEDEQIEVDAEGNLAIMQEGKKVVHKIEMVVPEEQIVASTAPVDEQMGE